MYIAILLVSFFVFVFLSAPIGVAIGMALCIYGLTGGAMGLEYISQAIFSSMNSFTLIAIPFFILAGALMEGGGLSKDS